jgi:thiol:disulfide interchange protein DsbD
MKPILLSGCTLFLAFVTSALQPIKDPAHWAFKVSPQNKTHVVELRLQADIDKGWHIYSSNNREEYSPIPANVSLKSSRIYKSLGELTSVGAEKRYEPAFGVQVELFRNKLVLVQKVKLLSPVSSIAGVVEYMACTDKEGRCVFKKVPFEVSL